MSSLITSQQLFAQIPAIVPNEKGATAFASTSNPILDLFTETRKKVPETLEEFTTLVRKIEAAKNHNSEMFVRLLKFHRLIEKGNGMKGVYYICMMILKEEDPVLYEQILEWSHEYPKDILRLARISSMFGGNASKSSGKANVTGDYPSVSFKTPLKYKTIAGTPKGVNGKRLTKWLLTEKQNGNVNTNSSGHRRDPTHKVEISAEIELYAQLVAKNIIKILDGKVFDDDVNLMLFKYLSHETGHFGVETKIIWQRVRDILYLEPVCKKLEFI